MIDVPHDEAAFGDPPSDLPPEPKDDLGFGPLPVTFRTGWQPSARPEELDTARGRQVGGDSVDHGIHGEKLVERSARMAANDLGAEIDEGIAPIGHVERAQRRACGNHIDM